ncbi:MAG: ABC transporter permease subunit [Paracoccaceae bacterium]|jgi:glycine betaine/proline transport system permease protein|nr:ABC transporter permease subunit [Paracoccaceae bacterium]MDG1939382.1 ABC transporter permease subunit [Paracoccaceae bacterium]|tara:strand:+ start:24 stop:2159 length:2136 start_codon:yes stop_codon:yes gene_type:complete
MTEISSSFGARKPFVIGGVDYSIPIYIILGLVVSVLVWFVFGFKYVFPSSISERYDFVLMINNGETWLHTHAKSYTRAASNFVGYYLEQLEMFLWFKPWPVITLFLVLPALHYGGLRLALFTLFGIMFWGMMDMWDPAMSTLALMGISVLFSGILGVILGIFCSQNDALEASVRPILDTMQTMPSFVYLLPAIVFFGIGGPPAAMAIIIYAMPPVVRLTNLGIRQVPDTTIEVAESFGSSRLQILFKVQIPQALPSIMLGINQTIMMALGLAVLAVFIGAGGLGEEVYKALKRLKVGWSVEGGICIVFMAIIFDRLSLAMSKPKDSDMLADNTEMRFRLLPQRLARIGIAILFEKIIDLIWTSIASLGHVLTYFIAAVFEKLISLVNRDVALSVSVWLRNSTFLIMSIGVIFGVMAWDTWVIEIGSFPRDWQFTIRKPIDEAVHYLTVNPNFYAFTTWLKETIFYYILNPLETFFTGLPWFYVLAGFAFISYFSAGKWFALVAFCLLFFTGLSGVWLLTMETLAAILASVAVCVIIGLPLGIFAAYNKTVDQIIRPVLDTMQTMPAFVYLIPVLYFFGGNRVTAVIATVIYALPPMVRMTNLGLRELPKQINEVSDSFGSTEIQSLIKVKLPMASPSIMLGVNQAVIMALAMQVITPLIAGEGLGKEVFRAMETADTGRGLIAGIGIVLLAILLDRLTQAWTANQRKALGL